jgi:3-deoxy-D-arabino-heptulosonate 7-phosphate (DAHP) synthase
MRKEIGSFMMIREIWSIPGIMMLESALGSGTSIIKAGKRRKYDISITEKC